MYSNADYKRLEPYLEYAFDKAHTVTPDNAEALYNYSVEESFIIVKELVLSRFYLLKLVDMCNPSFDYKANEEKIKDISLDWKPDGDWDREPIGEIILSPEKLIQLIDFVQGKGSQTNLF